jgi:hypothetical protein
MSYIPYRDRETRKNLVDAMNEVIREAQRKVVEAIPERDSKVAALAAKVREAIVYADDYRRGELAQAEAELVKAETDMNMAQIEVDQATSTLANTLHNLGVATGRDVTKYREMAMIQTKILNTCENMLKKNKNIVNEKTNMAAYQASEIYIVAIPQLGEAITELDKALANEGAISDLDGVEDRTTVLPVWNEQMAAAEARFAANNAAIIQNDKFREYKKAIKEVIRREEHATQLEKIAAEKATSSSVMPAERSETMDPSTEEAAPKQMWYQKPRRKGAYAEATANRSISTIPDSLASRTAATRRKRFDSRHGGITKRKKYRRYNKRKTKHYKKKAKRYTKKRNRRY